jgi:hypothetical protein
MKMRRDGVRYLGRIGNWEFSVQQATARWYGHFRLIADASQRWYVACRGKRTLAEAKASCVMWWLRMELRRVMELVGKKAAPFVSDCCKFQDELAPQVLRDWLTDNGKAHLVRQIIAAGKKAKVKWPPGWALVAASGAE